MFSFRRKPKKAPESPRIRASPSLPELNSQGIPWPEDLVDMAAIRREDAEHHHPAAPDADADAATQSPRSAAKTSFAAGDTPIPFHKPFRRPSVGGAAKESPISALYMAAGPPPSSFDRRALPHAARPSQRRARLPPTFNLMVVGGKGTGKTALLRLLLETADTSPGATGDQRAAVARFLAGAGRATGAIETACVEICESRFDRVLFTVIDTPGLDFAEGRELRLERQVSAVLKYVDAQYADTMAEESKVVRQSKGDQHIHLCIYMIDPSSVMTTAERGELLTMPVHTTRSETTISMRPPDLVPDTSSGDESHDEDDGPLTMAPAEIRVLRRLAARTNVLPVIARADSLTDEKLAAVKNAVRTGLAEAGIDFGVFGPPQKKKAESGAPSKRQTTFAVPNGSANGHQNGNGNDSSAIVEEEDEEEDEEERQSRPVIKLRATRHGRALSRSRSRRDLSQAAEDTRRRPISPDANDRESVANVRFSAHIVAKTDLSALLPFALIAPEVSKSAQRRRALGDHAAPLASPSQQPSDDGSEQPDAASPQDAASPLSDAVSPASTHSAKNYAFLQHNPPADLKGVFVRKFRWGTIDVLDPNHCDFAALRTAVLSTHLKLLKTHTKEVLYEKYRTEKLLARRATAQISKEEREQLLEDLGL